MMDLSRYGLVALAAFGAASLHGATTNRTETLLRSGFTRVDYVCDDTPCWRAHLMKIDLATPGLRFDVVYPKGLIGAQAPLSEHAEWLKKDLESRSGAKKVAFSAGINADFFGGPGFTQRLNVRDGVQLQTGYNPKCVNWGAGNLCLYETVDGKLHLGGVDFAGTVTAGAASWPVGLVNTFNQDGIAAGLAVFTAGCRAPFPAAGVRIAFDTPVSAHGGVSAKDRPFKVTGTVGKGDTAEAFGPAEAALVGLAEADRAALAALPVSAAGTLTWGLKGAVGDVRNLVGVWLNILKDGAVVPSTDQHEDFAKYPKGYPRTCFGLSRRDNRIVLFVNDGRQKGWSMHMSSRQVAEILRAEGCEDAGQFDGGGSTTLWDTADGVVNRPCGGVNPGTGGPLLLRGTQRPVAQSVFLSVLE